EELSIERLAVAEADFRFRRMDVHIDKVGRHFQKQKRDRVASHHQQAAVRLAERVLQRPVLNPAAIEKEILSLAGRLALAGMRDVAPDADSIQLRLDPDQLVDK